MTIQEAVKPGKRFRRPCMRWINLELSPLEMIPLSRSDILATDWEVEEKKIELTRKKLMGACHDLFSEGIQLTPNALAKALGLD